MYLHGREQVFYEIVEPLMLFTFVFQYKIISMVIFYERYGNTVLSVKVLFNDEVSERFIYTLKFGIEGTIVELYLFDDRRAFNVVVVCRKL